MKFRNAKGRDAALIAYRAASDVAAKGAMFVVTVLAARRLAAEAFGLFSIASTLGWMLAVGADAGIQLHLARAIALRPADAGLLLRRWLRVRLGTSAAAVAAALIVVGASGARGTTAAAVLVLAGSYIANGLLEFVYYFFRGLGRSDIESTLTIAHRAVLLSAAAAVLLSTPTVLALASAMLVAAGAALVVALVVANRVAATAGSEPCHARAERFAIAREFFADVLPIGAGILLSAIYFRVDLFLVARWLGVTAAGSYNAVFRLVEALRLFPAAVVAVVLPHLVRARDQRTVLHVAVGVTLFGAVVAATLAATAPLLVTALYGKAYADAAGAFRVLLFSFPLLSLNYALTHQLIGWRGQQDYVVICLEALVLNLALNAVLIPSAGLSGAAWATFWTEAFVTAACAAKLWARLPRSQADGDPVAAVTGA